MGVPLGGIGAGTICRGWRGDFVRYGTTAYRTYFIRWTLVPAAIPTIKVVDVDQFSVSIKDVSGPNADKRNSAVLYVPAKESTRSKAKVLTSLIFFCGPPVTVLRRFRFAKLLIRFTSIGISMVSKAILQPIMVYSLNLGPCTMVN